jgi:hypothetical protein
LLSLFALTVFAVGLKCGFAGREREVYNAALQTTSQEIGVDTAIPSIAVGATEVWDQ